MNEPHPNAALQGPVLDLEPEFLRSLPIDNLVGALLALTGEVYILRERLATLEAELGDRALVPAGAIETRELTPDEARERAGDLAAYTHRVLSELAKTRTPTSRIDPGVTKYLATYIELKNAGKMS